MLTIRVECLHLCLRLTHSLMRLKRVGPPPPRPTLGVTKEDPTCTPPDRVTGRGPLTMETPFERMTERTGTRTSPQGLLAGTPGVPSLTSDKAVAEGPPEVLRVTLLSRVGRTLTAGVVPLTRLEDLPV